MLDSQYIEVNSRWHVRGEGASFGYDWNTVPSEGCILFKVHPNGNVRPIFSITLVLLESRILTDSQYIVTQLRLAGNMPVRDTKFIAPHSGI